MAGWVCPECGLAYDSVAPTDAPVAIRSYPRRYRAELALPDDADPSVLFWRPDPGTWSAVEYTAHVADVFDAFVPRLRRVLVADRPELDFWDPDERAAAERYGDRSPAVVLDALATAAEALATLLDDVPADGWGRTGRWPWGERDVLTMARNTVHEGSHHLRDVRRVLAVAR